MAEIDLKAMLEAMGRPVTLRDTPFAAALDMSLHALTPGKATLFLPWNENLVGDPESGILHGGAITALMDQACGAAVMSTMRKLMPIATLDLRIDYMKPATPRRDVFAFAHCFKRTRTIAFLRGVTYHDTPDQPIATCTAAFMLNTRSERPSGKE